MSFSTDVAELTASLGPFYEYVSEEEAQREIEMKKEQENDEDEDEPEDYSVADSGVDVGFGQAIKREGELFLEEANRVRKEVEEVKQVMAEQKRGESPEVNEEEEVYEDPMTPEELANNNNNKAEHKVCCLLFHYSIDVNLKCH